MIRRGLLFVGFLCLVFSVVLRVAGQVPAGYIDEVVQLVNEARAQEGLAPLTLNAQLTTAAQGHAEAMASDEFYDHTNPITGTNVGERATAAGYAWLNIGENIAVGQDTPDDVVADWLASPDHRANILNPDHVEMGVGYFMEADDVFPTADAPYGVYWVQVFGSPAGVQQESGTVIERTFPENTIVIPMDDKQEDRIRVFGFIHAVLQAGEPVFRVIEPPNETLLTVSQPGGSSFLGGPFLVEVASLSVIETVQTAFPSVTVDFLTEQITLEQILPVTSPTDILVIEGDYGGTDTILTDMEIPFTLVQQSDIEANPNMVNDFDLIVDDCVGWAGNIPDDVALAIEGFVEEGGAFVVNDVSLQDANSIFPGKIELASFSESSISLSFVDSGEFPSQFYGPDEFLVDTTSSVSIITDVADDVSVTLASNTGTSSPLIGGFYFRHGAGLVEGLVFHPDDQQGDTLTLTTAFYGNILVRGEVAAQTPPSPTPEPTETPTEPPTATPTPSATRLPTATPLGTPLPPANTSMDITADPTEAEVDELITVQIDITADSSECGQSVVSKPVDVVLVLDVSGSMAGTPLAQAKSAAQAFVNEIDLATDRVGIAVFSNSARIVHPISTDAGSLSQAISTINIEGGTAIHTGLEVAFAELSSNMRGEATPVIVLLSDGESDRSAAQRAADTAKAADIKIATVGLGTSLDTTLLRSIASENEDGQPQYFESPDGSDLEQIYVNIAQSIREFNAASNFVLTLDLENYDFFIPPESFNPLPTDFDEERIMWELDVLEDGVTTFTFQVRPLVAGETDISRLTRATFLECEQVFSEIVIGPSPAIVVVQGPEDIPDVPISCDWWQTFPWWVLAPLLFLLLLLLFITLTLWGRKLWRTLRSKPLLCKILALLTLLYLLFLLALMGMALIGNLCDLPSVYFWQRDRDTGDIGIFVSTFGDDSARPVSEFNDTSNCVACHSGNSPAQLLSAVQDGQNGPVLVNTIAGEAAIAPAMNGSYVAWSPDGTMAAISWNDEDIYVANMISGTVAALTGASDPTLIETMPTWSADGQVIAFVRTTATDPLESARITAPSDIYTVPAGGGTPLPVIGASGDGFNYYPAYSPDGRWLAFTRHTEGVDSYADGEADLYIVPAGGGNPIYLRANSQSVDSQPSWSPDSRWLGFNSNRVGTAGELGEQFDTLVAEIGPSGQSSRAYRLPASATLEHSELHPVWVTSPVTTWQDRLLPLWPWLLPLIPLLFLGWWFCRERFYTVEGTVTDALTRQPIAGAQVKASQPPRDDQLVVTDSGGGYELHLPQGETTLSATMDGYIGQARYITVSGDERVDFQLYPLIEPVGMLMPPAPLAAWEQPPVWQPAPVLVIGLGGTGRHVLTQLKKNLRDAGAGRISEQVRLVLLDTSDYELLEGQQVPVSFAGVTLSRDDVVEYGEALGGLLESDEAVDVEIRGWFPAGEYRTRLAGAELDLTLGTRQRRPPARAGLVRDMKQGAEAKLWQLLRDEGAKAMDENGRLRVVLVGSLAGGMGSALVADVAYLARRAGRSLGVRDTSVEAHLATNGAFSRVATRPDVHSANTFASLRELERFQLAQGYPFRMVYNQDAAGDEVLAGQINWRLLDEMFLYDTPPNIPPVNALQEEAYYDPTISIFPAMADAIGLWLDKASRTGSLGQYRQAVLGSVTGEQAVRGRAVVGGLGSFVYRLPMYDLIAQLKVRWSLALLHYLIVGANDELGLNPGFNREYDPRATDDHVHQFLMGLTGFSSPTCPDMVAAIGTLAREGFSAIFRQRLQELELTDRDAERQAYHTYLLGGLVTVLNGRVDNDPGRARTGKLGYGLYFLEATYRALHHAADMLQGAPPDLPVDEAAKLAFLKDLLPELGDMTKQTALVLREQAGLLSQRLRPEDSADKSAGLYELLERLEQKKAALLAELDRVLVRQYVHPPGLVDAWYERYLAQDSFLVEALQRLYWVADGSGRVQLALQAWGEKPTLLGNDVAGFQAALLELASYATREIWQAETLASALAQTALHRDHVAETVDRLVIGSEPLLQYDTFKANATLWGMVLGANETVTEAADVANVLKVGLPSERKLTTLTTTDPYSLSMTQMVDVVPLSALGSLTEAEQVYRRWYGLLPRTSPDARAEVTAVFRAERIALMLEQRLQPELRMGARLLRPIIVTALDSGGVARLYALAYAAGWVRRAHGLVQLYLPEGRTVAVTTRQDSSLDRPGREWAIGFVRFAALPSDDIKALQVALAQVDEGVMDRWRLWAGRDWQQAELAQTLLAGDPDAADLAVVTALIVRDELKRRNPPQR